MRSKFDFVSETTGKMLLRTAFDAPPDGLTRDDVREIVKILRDTKRRLEEVVTIPVRLSVDNFEASVLWYLVLFRPVVFDKRHPGYGRRSWSVYELMRTEEDAKNMAMTDLGVFVDTKNMWLVLHWPEALTGVLAGIEECPSWRKILGTDARRQKYDFWKRVAMSHSFVVPTWVLQKMHYRKEHFGRGVSSTNDLIAFDMAGIDIPRVDAESYVGELPVAKRASFVHFYSEDPREYAAIRRIAQAAELRDENGRRMVQNARRRDVQRERRSRSAAEEKQTRRVLYDVTRAILGIPRLLGGGGDAGRSVPTLSELRSNELFNHLVTKFINGEYLDPRWKKIDTQVNKIENLLLLQDPHVPASFWKWTWWRDKAERIRVEYETGGIN